MKKTLKRIAAMLVIAVLTLSLTACSDEALQLLRGIVTATAPVTEVTPIGGADEPAVILLQGAEETRPDPVGVWKDTDCYDAMVVVAMNLGYSVEEAEELAAALEGAVFVVTLNPDKTGTVCFETAFNTTKGNFTWTADDEAITLTGDNGLGSVMRWDGGKLLYEYGGLQLVLEKEENTVASAPDAGEKSPVGTWEIGNLRQYMIDGLSMEGLSPEQIDIMLESVSIQAYFIFGEDGTFMLTGEDMTGGALSNQGTWTVTNTGVTIVLDGFHSNFVWDGDALVNEQDGLTLRLELVEAPECWVTTVQDDASVETIAKNPVGTWAISNMSQFAGNIWAEQGISREDADDLLANLGMYIHFILREDGTLTIAAGTANGEEVTGQGTWTATETGMTITCGITADFTWDGNALAGELGGYPVRLERVETPAS